MPMSADKTPMPSDAAGLKPLPRLIFASRWLQLPLYLGLIIAQGVYVVLFLKELWHLVLGAMRFTEQEIMLVVLGLIDVLMIKLAMAIIGISSIHLLRTFIYAGSLGQEGVPYTETGVMWQTIIHGLFILSAIGIAYVEKLNQQGQYTEHKGHH